MARRFLQHRKTLLLAVVALAPPFADAYPISPVTLWELVERSEIIVLAEVKSVSSLETKTTDWNSAVAKLQVLETWKGRATGTLEVPYPANLICPAPPVYDPGHQVIAFLVREKGMLSTVGLSYGTRYPETAEDALAYRTAVAQALEILQAHRDGQVEGAARRAWHNPASWPTTPRDGTAFTRWRRRPMSGTHATIGVSFRPDSPTTNAPSSRAPSLLPRRSMRHCRSCSGLGRSTIRGHGCRGERLRRAAEGAPLSLVGRGGVAADRGTTGPAPAGRRVRQLDHADLSGRSDRVLVGSGTGGGASGSACVGRGQAAVQARAAATPPTRATTIASARWAATPRSRHPDRRACVWAKSGRSRARWVDPAS